MAYYNKNKQYQADGSSAESKALDTFAELMIDSVVARWSVMAETMVYRVSVAYSEEPIWT